MNEQLWVVARFPDGTWSEGSKADDPDYALCEIFKVMASGRADARKKAQQLRQKQQREAKQKAANAQKFAAYPALACPRCGIERKPYRLRKDGGVTYSCPADHENHGSRYTWRIDVEGNLID